ncbi:hypothetical protein QFZ24_009650 [Streptomyces phaeochromogenes]|jgi:hypothetical protein|nr:hypothetical protein [Streptomyces phaeochromogenes]
MAVTQQLARIPTEYLAACRHSADTSQDRDPQWDPPTCDVLDLDWAPILLAGLGEVAGLDEVRLDAPRQATAGDTALDLGFLNTHPHGIAPFGPAPTALSAAQVAYVSALLGQIDMPAQLPAVPTDDREARAVISHGTDQLTGSPRDTCDAGCPPAGSGTVSPARASSHPDAWVGTAGSWNGPFPDCPTADASTAATSASRNTSSPSPPSPRPSYATADSPTDMTS